MLFNSYIFIFVFLPVTLLVFHSLRYLKRGRSAIFSLIVASFVFYGWWNPQYILLLVGLMASDCVIAQQIIRARQQNKRSAKFWLIIGLVINLGALGYYKYANFFVDNLNALMDWEILIGTVVLPIGISFFTFQKIAFLTDLYHGKVSRFSILNYSLFVTFFPQLIAGPIVHHSEVMPQFDKLERIEQKMVALGVTFFSIGLAKKVLIADTAARYASPHFNAAFGGETLDFVTAWGAAFAYTAQIYYDFSAYSDMAIGIALLFGIRLPINFDSPYKSRNIMDFWRRWHITLSRFLRDYLYIPLGGNQKGQGRRFINLIITMVLGGIWHGAGWTFLIWGTLHGLYLVINHAWHAIVRRLSLEPLRTNKVFTAFGWLITFLAVVVAWVFFRATSLDSAMSILASMTGQNGFGTPSLAAFLVPAIFLLGAVILPNTQQITNYIPPAGTSDRHLARPIPEALRWKLSSQWAVYVGVLFALSLMFMTQVSEFIYFQF